MSGVLTTSIGESWLVAGWAWRMLLNTAMEQAGTDAERSTLEQALYVQGLDLSYVDTDARTTLTETLANAATIVISDHPELASRAENGFLEAFEKLRTMLAIELSSDSGL